MPRKQLARTLKVVYVLEHDDKNGPAWIVEIPSVQGCHTYGRSLAEARRNAREALAVSLDDEDRDAIAEAAVFDEEIRIPARLRAAVRRYGRERALAEAAAAKHREKSASAARTLTEALSLRDAGELLGVSPEAVRKVLKAS